VARRPNVFVKMGGLGMAMGWFDFDFYQRPSPPTSQMLAHAFKPWFEIGIELLGAERCMFGSNFPVDKITSGYGALWNAFRRLAAGFSRSEGCPFCRHRPPYLLDRLMGRLTFQTAACNSVV